MTRGGKFRAAAAAAIAILSFTSAPSASAVDAARLPLGASRLGDPASLTIRDDGPLARTKQRLTAPRTDGLIALGDLLVPSASVYISGRPMVDLDGDGAVEISTLRYEHVRDATGSLRARRHLGLLDGATGAPLFSTEIPSATTDMVNVNMHLFDTAFLGDTNADGADDLTAISLLEARSRSLPLTEHTARIATIDGATGEMLMDQTYRGIELMERLYDQVPWSIDVAANADGSGVTVSVQRADARPPLGNPYTLSGSSQLISHDAGTGRVVGRTFDPIDGVIPTFQLATGLSGSEHPDLVRIADNETSTELSALTIDGVPLWSSTLAFGDIRYAYMTTLQLSASGNLELLALTFSGDDTTQNVSAFTSSGSLLWSSSDYHLPAGDVDGDGDVDLLDTVDLGDGTTRVSILDGETLNAISSRVFETPVGDLYDTFAYCCVGDLDADGVADLVLVWWANNEEADLYTYISGATMEPIRSSNIGTSGIGDFDGDGGDDLYEWSDGRVRILRGIDGAELWTTTVAPGGWVPLFQGDLIAGGSREVLLFEPSAQVTMLGVDGSIIWRYSL